MKTIKLIYLPLLMSVATLSWYLWLHLVRNWWLTLFTVLGTLVGTSIGGYFSIRWHHLDLASHIRWFFLTFTLMTLWIWSTN